ncbi:MAG: hypothetical protein OXC62_16380 [Aestuariivita sp.]|nr:hypothetical protein [Aestuariivita sp.]
MSGSVKDGKDLEVIFFDQDATIPATLPYSKNSEKILQWLKENVSLSNKFDVHDGHHIQAAMKTGRSSDETGGRGNGLATMKYLIDQAGNQSSLHILSRKGKYVYMKGGREDVENLEFSIGGTLIHWRLHL